MVLQALLDAIQTLLNVVQVILPHPSHLPPHEEEGWKDQDPDDVQDNLEVHRSEWQAL